MPLPFTDRGNPSSSNPLLLFFLSFRHGFRGNLNILASDTPAVGAPLYWDAGNSRLTTTASTHKKVGFCMNATLTVVATATLGSLPVGSWVDVYIFPQTT